MRHYLYQIYDTRLECWTFHQFMEGTPEQLSYSVKALSARKPETLVEKQDCILYCSGEVDFETGVVKIYDKREEIFDYRVAYKKAFPEQKELEVVKDEGSQS